MIHPERGYWIGKYTDLPNLVPLAIAADSLLAARLEDREWVRGAKRAPKSYYVNALTASDSLAPLLIKWGNEFKPYEGAQLSHVAVFISGLTRTWPWTKWSGTQLAHFDVNDPRHVKLFVLLSAVDEKNGAALKLWPANVSSAMYTGKARVNEDLLRQSDAVMITGPPGTAALVDTSRCIHYGSRGGFRKTLVIHWCSDAKKYSTRKSEMYEDLNLMS